jgi:hypothetical protein
VTSSRTGLAADGQEVIFVGMEEFGSYSASPLLVSHDFARAADIRHRRAIRLTARRRP